MNSNTTLVEMLLDIRSKILKPAPTLKLPEWADKHRYLSKAASAEPGLWRTTRVEVARGPMEAITDPSVEIVTVMACTQLLKTELVLNTIGYYMHQDPSPMIVVQPTLELAEAFSKDRIDHMINDSPELKELVNEKKRDSGNTILHKQFTGGHITMVGANAPAGLAMRPIRITLCDETDKYPDSSGKEGDPINLVEERTATFWNRKKIRVCSPTIKDRSRIEQSYEESDQRIYMVACPHCLEKQEMQWEQVKWPEDKPEKARYYCQKCDKPWNERERLKAVQTGEWVATAPFKGHAGFRCSKLVSPWESIPKLAEKYEKAKDKPEQIKTFTNTQLARSYKEATEVPDWKRIYRNREDRDFGIIPEEAVFVTAGVDVQSDRLEVEIVAWGVDKKSWSIDYRVIDGAPTEEATWDEFDKLVYELFPVEGGRKFVPIDKIGVDTGYATQDVYYFTRKYPKNKVYRLKGEDNFQSIISQPTHVDLNKNGKKLRRGITIRKVGSSYIKGELYGWLKTEPPLDGQKIPYGYCNFPMYGEDYFKMLTAEELQTKIVNGYPKKVWVKVRGRNEALDCRCYARAVASICGIDRMTREKLERARSNPIVIKGEAVVETKKTPPAEKTKLKRRKSSYL